MVRIDVRRMFWNQWTLMGSTMGNDAEFDAMIAELRARAASSRRSTAFSPSPTDAARTSGSPAGAQFGKVVVRVA